MVWWWRRKRKKELESIQEELDYWTRSTQVYREFNTDRIRQVKQLQEEIKLLKSRKDSMAEDVTITIAVTENNEEDASLSAAPQALGSVNPKENDMAIQLNVNVDNVPVKTENAYVDFGSVVVEADGQLEGSRLSRTGEKELTLTLSCDDQIVFDTEKLLAHILKAADLPISD